MFIFWFLKPEEKKLLYIYKLIHVGFCQIKKIPLIQLFKTWSIIATFLAVHLLGSS